ncbi:CD209 antigen-like protein C [Saccostrea echinata]|uniref:CD209 antigen-like protein C n=1 Tax=Saccostrea echinata TaxID=191078 RepID=UPI002A826C5A|nr:CD209 antigen-like protein C [Saccostrea echinata]
MKFFIVFAILITIYKTKTTSLLTGTLAQNTTVLINEKQEIKEIDVLRQIINQETIIRLALVKDVKAVVDDMDSLKTRIASSETAVKSLNENVTNIHKDLNNNSKRTCEKEGVNYQGNCYYFSTSIASFKDAMGACHLIDAEMVELQNAKEEKWLDLQFRLRGYQTHVWLGASDVQQEGKFISVSNAEELQYIHWVKGQPDNIRGIEHCATYWIRRKGMNDAPCHNKYNYVCKTNIL